MDINSKCFIFGIETRMGPLSSFNMVCSQVLTPGSYTRKSLQLSEQPKLVMMSGLETTEVPSTLEHIPGLTPIEIMNISTIASTS